MDAVAPGLECYCDCESGGIVRIIGSRLVHQAEGSLGICMFCYEFQCAIDPSRICRRYLLGYAEQRVENKRSQGLTGAQQAISSAVEAAIFGLLRPQILRGSL